jgi:hypothetical protein
MPEHMPYKMEWQSRYKKDFDSKPKRQVKRGRLNLVKVKFVHLPMKKALSEQIIQFISKLEFNGKLPHGIEVMNPYQENEQVLILASFFYTKFYNDDLPRQLILGINPGRLGAGATGIPFTDTKRLQQNCGIQFHGIETHEPSSVFIYKMIEAFGGPEIFYKRFLISSVSPLGFIQNNHGKKINFNYYDDKNLEKSVIPFALETLRATIKFGIDTEKVFCLGTGKNYKFLSEFNAKYRLFGEVIPLEHPRYIMQYKSKSIEEYVSRYLALLNNN